MSQSQLPALEHFDSDNDPASLGVRWEKWKRALDIYLFAANIVDPLKKRATLLHVGGPALQDIYFNIPGAHIQDEQVPVPGSSGTTQGDVYKIALEKLDEYFVPKQSGVYERHLFRLIKQDSGEKFEKFLLRLRTQSSKCNFSKEEENLIDQITEKCASNELRKKILTLGDTATLDKIITEANVLESVQRQLTDFNEGAQSINKIDIRKTNSFESKCARCGAARHKNENSCPAKNKECLKCGYVGHFKSQCRTRASKRKITTNSDR